MERTLAAGRLSAAPIRCSTGFGTFGCGAHGHVVIDLPRDELDEVRSGSLSLVSFQSFTNAVCE